MVFKTNASFNYILLLQPQLIMSNAIWYLVYYVTEIIPPPTHPHLSTKQNRNKFGDTIGSVYRLSARDINRRLLDTILSKRQKLFTKIVAKKMLIIAIVMRHCWHHTWLDELTHRERGGAEMWCCSVKRRRVGDCVLMLRFDYTSWAYILKNVLK